MNGFVAEDWPGEDHQIFPRNVKPVHLAHMERKQRHSSCPGDIGVADRRGTISNCPRRGARQSAPASIESAPSLLRLDCSRPISSPVSTDDQSVSEFKAPLSPTSQQQAADAHASTQVTPKTIPLEESWENSRGSEIKSTPSSARYHGAAGTEEARQEEPAAVPLKPGEDRGSGRESKSSAPCSSVQERTGASATSRSKPFKIPLEPARHAVVTASGRSATTEEDYTQTRLKKGFYASTSQAGKLAKNREDFSTPSTSMGFTGTEGGKFSTRATRENAGGGSVSAQREHPRKEHRVPASGRYESRGDINVGASTSQGFVGMQARKPSSTSKKGHRETEGDSDNQSAPEWISSGDESSVVASSGATEGASAFPSKGYENEFVRASVRLEEKHKRLRMEYVARLASSDAVDPIEGTSSGTLSAPTHAERRLDKLSDYLSDLSTIIREGMVNTVRQGNTEAEKLLTEMRQLIENLKKHTQKTKLRIAEHIAFIHDVRMKLEQEQLELEQLELEQLEREQLERERLERERLERLERERLEREKMKKKRKKTKKGKK